MEYTVTVSANMDKAQLTATLEACGVSVTRVAVKRGAAGPVGVSRIGRASALTDMPDGLTRDEQKAYVRGYAQGAHRFTRKHGAPSITGPRGGVVDRVQLRRITREHEWDRHPTAHKAGLREVEKYRGRRLFAQAG